MNKKELSEIKKQFKFSNKKFSIDKIIVYYINKDNKIICKENKKFNPIKNMENGISSSNFWNEREEKKFFEIFKKTLTGQLGKIQNEYYFKNDDILNKDSIYSKLLNLYEDYFATESIIDEYITFVKDNMNLQKDYAICVCNCSYIIPSEDKTKCEEDNESYEFIVISLCDSEKFDIGLSYQDNEIKQYPDRPIIIKNPFCGYIFPTFNNRQTDLNSVLVYDNKPKAPQKQLVENILGCKYVMRPEQEKEKFNTLLTKIATKDDDANIKVDYSIIESVYKQINQLIIDESLETQLPTLNMNQLKNIFLRSGISEENLKQYEEIFEKEFGSNKIELKTVNLIDPDKFKIKSNNMSIQINGTDSEKIEPKIIDGKRYLLVEVDDSVNINGMQVNIK